MLEERFLNTKYLQLLKNYYDAMKYILFIGCIAYKLVFKVLCQPLS